jgi:hypothetical protein
MSGVRRSDGGLAVKAWRGGGCDDDKDGESTAGAS